MVCPWVKNGTLPTYLKQNNNLTVAKKVTLIGSHWNLPWLVAKILLSRSMTWRVAYDTVCWHPLYCLISLTICLTVHSQHIVHGDLSGIHILAVVPGSSLIHQNNSQMYWSMVTGEPVLPILVCPHYWPSWVDRLLWQPIGQKALVWWMAPELLDPEDDSQTTLTTQTAVYLFESIMLQVHGTSPLLVCNWMEHQEGSGMLHALSPSLSRWTSTFCHYERCAVKATWWSVGDGA